MSEKKRTKAEATYIVPDFLSDMANLSLLGSDLSKNTKPLIELLTCLKTPGSVCSIRIHGVGNNMVIYESACNNELYLWF